MTFTVEEIISRTEMETLQRIYKLPNWDTMLELLTMLALSTGRLLKVRLVGFWWSLLTLSLSGGYSRPVVCGPYHSQGLECQQNTLFFGPSSRPSL
jgi:hypothetical protein